MIHIKDLKSDDIGRMVVYLEGFPFTDEGIITGCNEKYIFVQYKGDIGSKATHPIDLKWSYK